MLQSKPDNREPVVVSPRLAAKKKAGLTFWMSPAWRVEKG